MAGVLDMIELLNPSAPAFKSASINQVIARMLGDTKKTKATIQTLFHEQGWFWRAVDLRAKSIQNLPWHITRVGSEDPVWDCDDPGIPDELAFAKDLPRLLYLWEACLVTVQKAYTLKESEGRGVDGLFYFNPTKVEPVKDADRGIYQYKRMVNGSYEYYDAEDMLALFHADPFVEAGPGVATAAKKNVEVLRALEGFLHSFMDKGAIKATLLTVDGDFGGSGQEAEDARSRLKKAWNRFLSGWSNGGAAQIFSHKVTPHTIGDGLKDLSNGELTKQEREAICAALGIPMSLMMSNAANFATAEMDQVNYIKHTVEPEAKFIMRALNEQLFTPAGFRFVFEARKLEVLQRYELDKASKVQAVVGQPVLTVDEGRELLGYAPLTGSQDASQEDRDTSTQPEADEALTEDVKALVLEFREFREFKETIQARKGFEVPQSIPVPSPLPYVSTVDLGYRDVSGLPLDLSDEQLKESVREYDLKAWQRKVKRKGRDVKFSPDHLNAFEAAVIRERLETDAPLDEVFKEPFINF